MQRNDRILYIDTWRFFAVMLVIASHVIRFGSPAYFSKNMPGLFWRAPLLGESGVFVFFCISGFVICRGMISEQRSTQRVSLRAFYFRRGLRILPPLILYIFAVIAIASFTAVHVSGTALLQAATFLCNVTLIGDCGWLLGHTWTLAYEEQFYLFFPLFFIILRLHERPQLLVLAIVSMTVVTVSFALNMNQAAADPMICFIYMLVGCAAALYWTTLRLILQSMSVVTWLLLVGLIFLLAGLVTLPTHVHEIGRAALLPALVCLVVLGTPVSNKFIKHIFENKAFTYLGKISYTAYLWQQLATGNYPTIPSWIKFLMIIAVFIFEHFSYQYFEKPFIKLGSKDTDY